MRLYSLIIPGLEPRVLLGHPGRCYADTQCGRMYTMVYPGWCICPVCTRVVYMPSMYPGGIPPAMYPGWWHLPCTRVGDTSHVPGCRYPSPVPGCRYPSHVPGWVYTSGCWLFPVGLYLRVLIIPSFLHSWDQNLRGLSG